MDDAGDLALVEHSFERLDVGDVAADDRHPIAVVAEHETQSRGVVPEVVAHDLVPVGERRPRDPGSEAAEDAGDEEPLAHASGASWYTVTASVKNSSAARPCSCGP